MWGGGRSEMFFRFYIYISDVSLQFFPPGTAGRPLNEKGRASQPGQPHRGPQTHSGRRQLYKGASSTRLG